MGSELDGIITSLFFFTAVCIFPWDQKILAFVPGRQCAWHGAGAWMPGASGTKSSALATTTREPDTVGALIIRYWTPGPLYYAIAVMRHRTKE